MNEHLVEWTLLREKNYLQECIKLPLEKKICQQFTTDYGRIDFAHKIKDGGILITELETIIDSRAKLSYCIEQTQQYQNIRFNTSDEHLICILIANQTKTNYQQEIRNFCNQNNIKYSVYDLDVVKKLYEKEIEKSLTNVGVPLAKPVAMNLTHLASFNRLFIPFYLKNKDKLHISDFSDFFNVLDTQKSKSTFNVIFYGASYFDLIYKKNEIYILTDLGINFRDNINANEIVPNVKKIGLSIEQKRILIQSLLNGNFYEKKSKINIFYFLKFVALTEGEWIPRGRNFDDKAKLDFINNFLKMNYTEGTVANWLQFTCNHCVELGLVEKIKTRGFYDSVVLTTLGSRVLNFLEFDISHKREQIQIPLQI
ncbi:MAG: hypothetical protein KatS3mg028_1227 [Bacteroidia bacterium]|nr:MAG: hypothetical protein KatS3mg028_1227 [Bacteroidia bacterium]